MSALPEMSYVAGVYPDRLVLGEVSFKAGSGEVLAVVGPNGVGKSSLIKAASGVLPVTRGRVLVVGQEVGLLASDHRARLIGGGPIPLHRENRSEYA